MSQSCAIKMKLEFLTQWEVRQSRSTLSSKSGSVGRVRIAYQWLLMEWIWAINKSPTASLTKDCHDNQVELTKQSPWRWSHLEKALKVFRCRRLDMIVDLTSSLLRLGKMFWRKRNYAGQVKKWRWIWGTYRISVVWNELVTKNIMQATFEFFMILV